jgi:hypothetical protein
MSKLADYVLRYYPRLMTAHERAVYRHLTALYKFRSGGPPAPGTAAETDGISGPVARWQLSDDPSVITDAQAGWDEARTRIAERILRDHPDEVYLNRCPQCNALTATPRARLCLTCGHTWFHIPRDQRL